jgi:hypothetical protein
MQSRQVTGVVLIAGIAAMIVGIAAHPHHGPVESSSDAEWRNLVVAVIVLTSYGALGVGFLRLLRSMTPRPWNDAAGVALAFAGVCGAGAAVVGHVVVPRFLERAGSDDLMQAQANLVVTNDMILSFTLAQASLVAWAIGVLFLSIALFHDRSGWKVVGASGVVLGLLILMALALGRLELSLHNVGLVVVASGIWVCAIGAALCANKSLAGLVPVGEGD